DGDTTRSDRRARSPPTGSPGRRAPRSPRSSARARDSSARRASASSRCPAARARSRPAPTNPSGEPSSVRGNRRVTTHLRTLLTAATRAHGAHRWEEQPRKPVMIERHSVIALLVLGGCGTTQLGDDSSAVSRDWFAGHIPPGSALEQSVIEIANDASLDLTSIGVPLKTATAVAALRGPDGYRSIAEIDDAPHTNIPFFETLIAYANRNLHGGHARSGCTRPHTNPPPDSLLAFDAQSDALSWAFAVPEH